MRIDVKHLVSDDYRKERSKILGLDGMNDTYAPLAYESITKKS